MIVSASRRTDIPAHYLPWLINRLRAGYALVRNPMNRSQLFRVSLIPDDVDMLVLWSKDAAPLLGAVDEIERLGVPIYVHWTLTPYGRDVERHLRDKDALVRDFQALSRRIGPRRLMWRYDPILLAGNMTVRWHLGQFERLCGALAECAAGVTISFVDEYKKLPPGAVRALTADEMARLGEGIGAIAAAHRLPACTCCETIDLARYGIAHGACIDRPAIERLIGRPLAAKPDRSQRPGCGCAASVDIGAYDSCPNGCVYCYANASPHAVAQNIARHRPDGELLIGDVAPGEVIRTHKGG